MRRILVPGLVSALPLLGVAGVAGASSIVAISAPEATPSIMPAGEAAPAPVEARPVAAASGGTDVLAIGNSVVAIGADAIPPSREAVASIEEEAPGPELPAWLSDDGAPALRGGIGGEAASHD